jgi:hypothetical protein
VEKDNIEVDFVPPSHGVSDPSTPARKHRHTHSDGAHRCRVVPSVVAMANDEARLHVVEEEMSRGPANRCLVLSLVLTMMTPSHARDSSTYHH